MAMALVDLLRPGLRQAVSAFIEVDERPSLAQDGGLSAQ